LVGGVAVAVIAIAAIYLGAQRKSVEPSSSALASNPATQERVDAKEPVWAPVSRQETPSPAAPPTGQETSTPAPPRFRHGSGTGATTAADTESMKSKSGNGPSGPSSPMLVSEAKDWKVVIANSPKGKVCFAMSRPTRKEPTTLAHGDVYFFVSSTPADNKRNEPSMEFGYQLRESNKVIIAVGGKEYDFIARGNGAWLGTSNEREDFLRTMGSNRNFTVSARSQSGVSASYVFSLSGVGAAIAQAADDCRN
jgi:hypothetical protein